MFIEHLKTLLSGAGVVTLARGAADNLVLTYTEAGCHPMTWWGVDFEDLAKNLETFEEGMV